MSHEEKANIQSGSHANQLISQLAYRPIILSANKPINQPDMENTRRRKKSRVQFYPENVLKFLLPDIEKADSC